MTSSICSYLVKSSSKLFTISFPGSDGRTGGVVFLSAKASQSVFAKKSFALTSSHAAKSFPHPSRRASVTWRVRTAYKRSPFHSPSWNLLRACLRFHPSTPLRLQSPTRPQIEQSDSFDNPPGPVPYQALFSCPERIQHVIYPSELSPIRVTPKHSPTQIDHLLQYMPRRSQGLKCASPSAGTKKQKREYPPRLKESKGERGRKIRRPADSTQPLQWRLWSYSSSTVQPAACSSPSRYNL